MSLNLVLRGKNIYIPPLTEYELSNVIEKYIPTLVLPKELIPRSRTYEASDGKFYIELAIYHIEEDKKEGVPGRTLLHEFLHLFIDFHGIGFRDGGLRPHEIFDEKIEEEAGKLAKKHPELLQVIKEFYNMGENNPIGI